MASTLITVAPTGAEADKAAVPALTTDVRYRTYRDYPYASYWGYPTYSYYGYPTYNYAYPGYRTYSPYWNAYGWW